MPKESNVGLSLKDSFAEALNEDVTASSTESVNSESVVTPNVLNVEQPTAEGEGVLTALIDNSKKEPDTNNPLADSALIVVDGVQLTLSELKNGYRRQADYTRDKQALSEEKKAVQNAITLWQALESDPVNTVRKLSQKVNLGYNPTNDEAKYGNEPKSSATDIDKLVADRVNALLSSDPRLQALESQQAQTAVGAEFDRIEKSWGVKLSDQDKLMVLQKAQQTGVNDIEFVFAGLLNIASRKAAERKQLQATSTVSGGQSDPLQPNPIPQKTPDTFREALEQAMQELSIERL